MRRPALVLALLAMLAATACATNESATETTPTANAQTPNPDIKPAVQITYPEKGKELPAGDVIVAITVTSFNVVDKLGQEAKDGEGHVHFYVDVKDLPTEPGKPAVTDDERTYHAAAGTSYTWEDVDEGTHRFGVQLVNNDHTPLDPPVTDKVKATIGGD